MGNPIEFRELLVKMHNDRMTSRWGAYSYNHKKPIWNARFETGKTILITGEAGIGDELLYIQSGFGIFKSNLGIIKISQGDYVVIPRGIIWQLIPNKEIKILIIEYMK